MYSPSTARLIASATLALVCLVGCDRSRTEPLPVLIVPADFTVAEQLDLLRIHFLERNRFLAEGIDVRVDFKDHVNVNLTAAVSHHREWGNRTQGYREDHERLYAMLERMPEVSRYRGARLRAVALGLLAMSIWRRDPPARAPSVREMRRCMFSVGIRGRCDHSARTLALYRTIVAAQHADGDLFKRLSEQQAQLMAPSPTRADHDQPTTTTKTDSK